MCHKGFSRKKTAQEAENNEYFKNPPRTGAHIIFLSGF